MVTVDLLLEVDTDGDGQVHGIRSRGDAAIECHLLGGYSGAIWTAPRRDHQLFQALRSEHLLGRGYWQARVGDGGFFLSCRNLDPSCQTLSDLDGFDTAGGVPKRPAL